METKRVKSTIPPRVDMMRGLQDQGFLVVRGLVPEEECDKMYGMFWAYLQGMFEKLDPLDRDTWRPSIRKNPETGELIPANLPASRRGLIQAYNAGLQPFNIHARNLVKPLFEELWGTARLTTSFDGGSFTANRVGRPASYKSVADWKTRCWDETPVHIDQTTPVSLRETHDPLDPKSYEELSIQGGLAVTTQRENEHVFVCVPGSHKYHAELLAIRNEKPVKKNTLHWDLMEKKQLAFLRDKGLEMIRVELGKGDFVLWDSRTVHSSASYCKDADRTATRLQLMIAMRPAVNCPKDRLVRWKAYNQGIVSKHSPDYLRLFSKNPAMKGKTYAHYDAMKHLIPASAEMTREEQKLHGLIAYEETDAP